MTVVPMVISAASTPDPSAGSVARGPRSRATARRRAAPTDAESRRRSMRVLILAEECNPEWPSGPAFAYQAARAIAEHADVVLVTEIRNGANIQRAGLGRARVVYVNTQAVAAPLWKLGLALRRDARTGWLLADVLAYPGQMAFEWLAARRFGPALRRGEFDLVHRLSPWIGLQPSYMAHRCPVPFLLGPVNDSLPWPAVSTAVLQREATRADRIGAAVLPFLRRLPYGRSKYLAASGILACYDHTIAGLPDSVKSKTINFPDVGIDPIRFRLPARVPQERKTILFAGRLVPLKQPEVLVRAFAASPLLRRHRLRIVGDGPEREPLERLVAEHHLADSVELTGGQSQADVGRLMQQADIFAFPSVHEMGGAVVVEAMACGLACVVVDFGGPGTLVGPGWGLKVPLGNAAQLTGAFQQALETLIQAPEWTAQLGLAAHRHAMQYYTWDAKARKTLEIYRWVTGRQARKPNFWDAPSVTTAPE